MSTAARPNSVTVIGWTCIVASVIGFATSPITSVDMMQDPEVQKRMARDDPQTLSIFFAALGREVALLSIFQTGFIAGVLILKGMGWSRWLLVATYAAAAIYRIVRVGPDVWIVPGLLVAAISIYLLYRSPAAAFFAARKADGSPRSPQLNAQF